MSSKFKIEGLEQLDKKFQKMAKNVGAEKVEPLLFASAKIVTEAQRARAPQGPTGNLKRAHVTKQLPARGRQIGAAIAAIDRRIAPHAGLVEFGTSKMPAKPYFRSGWDATRGKAKQIIEQGLKNLVEGGAK